MPDLAFLMSSHPWYNFMNAALSSGLKKLGYPCYGLNQNANNFLDPHTEQDFNVFIQCMPGDIPPIVQNKKNCVKVFLWGEDGGPFTAQYLHWMQSYDACFVRDLTGDSPPHMLPMNFGIEERFYCATPDGPGKLLKDRSIDVIFLGRMGYGNRDRLIKAIQCEFAGANLLFDGHKFSTPDPYWAQWLNVHCCHDPRYYEALADSKLILSLSGAGPDCARHWEAFASGGIPMVEYAPTRVIEPGFRNKKNCFQFRSEQELLRVIDDVLRDPEEYQHVAHASYADGKMHHTTEARAQYVIDSLVKLELV